jgi:hypothetical protein
LFTKKQLTQIDKLGGEWTVLDAEEEHISRFLFEQYYGSRPEPRPPQELRELERRQREIFERKRTLSYELDAVESGTPIPARRSRGKSPDPYVMVRDLLIRRMSYRRDEEICRTLDLGLAGREGGSSLALPSNWTEKFGVKSYLEAYEHPACRSLVQKVISVAKTKHISYLI